MQQKGFEMKYLPLLGVVLSLFMASCTSENAPKRQSVRRSPEVFRKLKDYSLQLSMLTPKREFYAGDDRAVLTFALKNTGLKQITIFEWHTHEAANINLYYREGKADAPVPASAWKRSESFDPAKVNLHARSPLTLNPGKNQALVQVPASFLKMLRNPSGKKIPYTLRAVLNLQSVTVESEPIEIYVK